MSLWICPLLEEFWGEQENGCEEAISHRIHSIFYIDVSYSLNQVIIRKYCEIFPKWEKEGRRATIIITASGGTERIDYTEQSSPNSPGWKGRMWTDGTKEELSLLSVGYIWPVASFANLSATALPLLLTCIKEKELKHKAKVLASSTMWPKEARHVKSELMALVSGNCFCVALKDHLLRPRFLAMNFLIHLTEECHGTSMPVQRIVLTLITIVCEY